MPKTVFFPRDSQSDREGIDISYTKTTQLFRISGWYDSMVGMASDELTLREFLEAFGITEADVRKAFKARQGAGETE